jgi:hypothetical protein
VNSSSRDKRFFSLKARLARAFNSVHLARILPPRKRR